MGLSAYLMVSAGLFALGMVMFISKRNTIAILMGVELVLNSAALNFMAFSYFTPSKGNQLDGQIFAIFIILLAAAEAVVALGIAIAAYKEYKHVQADELISLKG